MHPKPECSKCGLSHFASLDSLETHIAEQHFGDVDAYYECLYPNCHIRFHTAVACLKHELVVHLNGDHLHSTTLIKRRYFVRQRLAIHECLNQSINVMGIFSAHAEPNVTNSESLTTNDAEGKKHTNIQDRASSSRTNNLESVIPTSDSVMPTISYGKKSESLTTNDAEGKKSINLQDAAASNPTNNPDPINDSLEAVIESVARRTNSISSVSQLPKPGLPNSGLYDEQNKRSCAEKTGARLVKLAPKPGLPANTQRPYTQKIAARLVNVSVAAGPALSNNGMPCGKPLTVFEQGQIYAFYRQGRSFEWISKKTGRSKFVIHHFLKDPHSYSVKSHMRRELQRFYVPGVPIRTLYRALQSSQNLARRKMSRRVSVTADPALSNNESISKNNETIEPVTSSSLPLVKYEPSLMDELTETIPGPSDHSDYLNIGNTGNCEKSVVKGEPCVIENLTTAFPAPTDHDYLSFSNNEFAAALPQPKRSRIEISPEISSKPSVIKDEPSLMDELVETIPGPSDHSDTLTLGDAGKLTPALERKSQREQKLTKLRTSYNPAINLDHLNQRESVTCLTAANSSISKLRIPDPKEISEPNNENDMRIEPENSSRSCVVKVGHRFINVMATADPVISSNVPIDKNNETVEPETSSSISVVKDEPCLIEELAPAISDSSNRSGSLTTSNKEPTAPLPKPKKSRKQNFSALNDEDAKRNEPENSSRSSVIKEESCLVHELDPDIPGPSNYRHSNKQRASSKGASTLRYSENLSSEKAEHENSVVKDEPSLIDELAAMIPAPSSIDEYLIRSSNKSAPPSQKPKRSRKQDFTDLDSEDIKMRVHVPRDEPSLLDEQIDDYLIRSNNGEIKDCTDLSSNVKKSRKQNLDDVSDEDDRDFLFSKDLQILSLQHPGKKCDDSLDNLESAARTEKEKLREEKLHEQKVRENELKSKFEKIKNDILPEQKKERTVTTPAIKRAVIKAKSEGLLTKQIATIFDISVSTVHNIMIRWQTAGTVENKPRRKGSGRKRKYDEAIEQFVFSIIKEDPYITPTIVQSEIKKKFDRTISSRVVRIIIKRSNSLQFQSTTESVDSYNVTERMLQKKKKKLSQKKNKPS